MPGVGPQVVLEAELKLRLGSTREAGHEIVGAVKSQHVQLGLVRAFGWGGRDRSGPRGRVVQLEPDHEARGREGELDPDPVHVEPHGNGIAVPSAAS